MATTDTLAMDSVDTLEIPADIAGEPEPTEAPEPAKADAPESTDPDTEPSSFANAMKKALAGKEAAEDKAKAEPAPEPEPEPEPGESRAAGDFKKIKAERDDAKSKMAELEAKLGELQNSDVDELLQQVQTERDDLSQRLKLVGIERHPKFQQEYQNRLNGIVERAKSLVGAEHADRVADLLGMQDGDYRNNGLEEIMLELSTAKQAQLGAMLASVDEVRHDRDAALANADDTYQRMVADEATQREAALEQTNKVFDAVLDEAVNLELFQVRDEDDGWNNEVADRVATARNIFSGDNAPEELARASMWAAAGPKYREMVGQLLEVNRRLREQVKEQAGATPSVGSSGGDSPTEPKSFIDQVSEMMGQ